MSEKSEFTLPGNAVVDLIQAVLERGSVLRIQAGGFSMSPFIRNGDVVILSALRGRSPRLGDVVAIRIPCTDRLAFHRVAGRVGDLYIIRGDNCDEADGLVSKNKILGRVSGVERNGTAVPFGLGPERRMVAILSRNNVLITLRTLVSRIA